MTGQSLSESIAALDGMLFIDGGFRAGQGMRLPVENPATGEVIGHIAAATAAEVEVAVQAARRKPAQRRSTRSRFMTLVQAATKSRTNFSRASSCA